jgi:Ala-tRNA(Pro) deacylase
MREVAPRLQAMLDDCRISYETLEHELDYTARQAASDTHTPEAEFAKAVILRVGADYAMAVLPARHHVHLGALRAALGTQDVALASEGEIATLIPDCEWGAAPPFGGLYDLPVYLSPALAHCRRVTFNAGTHTTAIRMSYRDFERFAGGRVIDFSTLPRTESAPPGTVVA